jgi:hypothetical protein
MWGASNVRAGYLKGVAGLDATDVAGRTALKAAARAETPSMVGGVVQMMRPGLGPRAGSTSSANVTNAEANATGRALGLGGKLLVGAAFAMSAYSIATADDPARETFVQGLGIVGGIGGGAGGGALGTLAEPGGGSVVGGVSGAIGGSLGGSKFGGWLYDKLFGN